MKRLLIIIMLAVLPVSLHAQETVDTLNLKVFENLSDSLTIHQSEAVRIAMENHVRHNARLTALGIAEQTYAIRIFSDNGQEARSQWDATADSFTRRFPGVPVSKTFDEPFFKVTVGDYSSKAEANAALKRILIEYPSAFIVKN